MHSGHHDGNAAHDKAVPLAHAQLPRAQSHRQVVRGAGRSGGPLCGNDAGLQAHARHPDAHAAAVVQHAARIQAAHRVLQGVFEAHARVAGHRPAEHPGRAAGIAEPFQLPADAALSARQACGKAQNCNYGA